MIGDQKTIVNTNQIGNGDAAHFTVTVIPGMPAIVEMRGPVEVERRFGTMSAQNLNQSDVVFDAIIPTSNDSHAWHFSAMSA